MLDVQQAQRELAPLFDAPCRLTGAGSDITGETGVLTAGARRYFFKWMADGDALDAERDGLRALAHGVRVPAVVHHGPLAGGEVLVLEWLALRPLRDGAALGRALKRLHGVSAQRFGHHRDNWIGGSRQYNAPMACWADFFVERRLAPQLRRARDRGLSAATVADLESVLRRVPGWLNGVVATPSLVHGDLWQGNVAALPDGEPVLFDPAVYYGHGEVDLAMLGLFGEVPAGLHDAYGLNRQDADLRHRERLYNLYHLLNHFVLFGDGYRQAVAARVGALLSA